MGEKEDIRNRINEQHAKVARWRKLFNAKDDQQDEVSDTIDDARMDLAQLRKLRDGLVEGRRHEHWTEKEIEDRRKELASAIADGLDAIDHLIQRLQSVKDKKQKARRHLADHEERLAKLQKKIDWLKAHPPPPPPPSGLIVPYDGHSVAGWIVREALIPARSAGVQFTVISGYRSPEFSESLCIAMCGQPSCPGMCAGRASNHSCPSTFTCKEFEGAVDVSPGYSALRAWCSTHGWPIIGGGVVLPSDLPHFSKSGR